MSSRITYFKDIYYFQVFLLVPAKGLKIVLNVKEKRYKKGEKYIKVRDEGEGGTY